MRSSWMSGQLKALLNICLEYINYLQSHYVTGQTTYNFVIVWEYWCEWYYLHKCMIGTGVWW